VPLPPINVVDDISGGESLVVFLAVAVTLGCVALIVYGGVQFWQEVASAWF
jgi:hypothetical protein